MFIQTFSLQRDFASPTYSFLYPQYFVTLSTLLLLHFTLSYSQRCFLSNHLGFLLPSKMFRQGLRRCANQARTTASAALVTQCRSALPIGRHGITPLAASIMPLRRLAAFQRTFTSESAAEVTESGDVSSRELTKFSELLDLGVHPNLINAITKDLQYEDMTPVQAKTIGPALKGTDM